MKKTIILSLLFLAGASHATIRELVEPLDSSDLSIQTEANAALFAECSKAGRPGAETERVALCKEITALLAKGCSAPVATQLVRNLQRIGAEESVPELAAMLRKTDFPLRDDVRQALAINPSPAAGKALRSELKKSKDPRWTAGLIVALGERSEVGASTLIAPYLSSNDPFVFTAAAKALGRLAEPEGIQALLSRREKEAGARRMVLTAELFETNRKEVYQQLHAATESEEVRAVALLGLTMNNDRKAAVTAMASGRADFQTTVIEAASQLGDDGLYRLLAKGLNQFPPHLQVQALGVLEFSGEKKYSSVMVSLLASKDADVRVSAAKALSRVGTADAVQPMLAAGVENDEAKKALGMIDAEGVDEVLLKAAKSGDGAQRSVAIEALALRGRTEMMDRFFAYADDSDEQVAKAAVLAIKILGRDQDLGAVVDLMLAHEKSPLSRDLLKASVFIVRRAENQGDMVSVMVKRMSGASPRGQALVLQALAQIGSAEALEPVVKAAQSSDESLRKQAVKLLGNWPNDKAVPALLQIAGEPSAPLNDHVMAIRGISRLLAGQKKLNEEAAIQALEICRRSDEKKLILGVLGKAKSDEAKAAVKACLSDPDLEVEAQDALKQIEGGGRKKKKSK